MIAESGAKMVRQIRRIRELENIDPSDIWNFDELRIYASPQDLNTYTLEFSDKRDPEVRKIANPKEAYTGIVAVSGDGENLMIFLVTNKKLPEEYPVETLTLTRRVWEKNEVKQFPVIFHFMKIHGITVLKVSPGNKSWCSALVTEAFLRLILFKTNRPTILQVL